VGRASRSITQATPEGGVSQFYIGRSAWGAGIGDNMKFASVIIDELEIWYGDRSSLIFFDFIQRGKQGDG